MFGLAGPGPGALVWILWILLLVVGTNPTTLFQNISQLRNEKDMADRKKLLVSAVSKPVNDSDRVVMIP